MANIELIDNVRRQVGGTGTWNAGAGGGMLEHRGIGRVERVLVGDGWGLAMVVVVVDKGRGWLGGGKGIGVRVRPGVEDGVLEREVEVGTGHEGRRLGVLNE